MHSRIAYAISIEEALSLSQQFSKHIFQQLKPSVTPSSRYSGTAAEVTSIKVQNKLHAISSASFYPYLNPKPDSQNPGLRSWIPVNHLHPHVAKRHALQRSLCHVIADIRVQQRTSHAKYL